MNYYEEIKKLCNSISDENKGKLSIGSDRMLDIINDRARWMQLEIDKLNETIVKMAKEKYIK